MSLVPTSPNRQRPFTMDGTRERPWTIKYSFTEDYLGNGKFLIFQFHIPGISQPSHLRTQWDLHTRVLSVHAFKPYPSPPAEPTHQPTPLIYGWFYADTTKTGVMQSKVQASDATCAYDRGVLYVWLPLGKARQGGEGTINVPWNPDAPRATKNKRIQVYEGVSLRPNPLNTMRTVPPILHYQQNAVTGMVTARFELPGVAAHAVEVSVPSWDAIEVRGEHEGFERCLFYGIVPFSGSVSATEVKAIMSPLTGVLTLTFPLARGCVREPLRYPLHFHPPKPTYEPGVCYHDVRFVKAPQGVGRCIPGPCPLNPH